MGRPQDCAFDLPDEVGAVADTSPPMSADAVGEAALAALEDLDNRRLAGCPQCGSSALQRWGKGRAKVQRWRCRDCERSFSSTTGTMLAGLHAPGKLRLVLIDMLSSEPSTCRTLATKLTLSAMTIWAWRQRINQALEQIAVNRHDAHDTAPRTVDTVVLRESRKASREWVDHRRDPASHPTPDRHRWVDYRVRHLPLPEPMTPHLLAVQLTADHLGNWHATLRPTLPARTYASATSSASVADVATKAPEAAAVPPAAHHGPTDDRMPEQDGEASPHGFRTFLRPFAGPAKRYLGGYLAWFVAWRAGRGEACGLDMANRAWRALTTPRPTRFCTCAPRTA